MSSRYTPLAVRFARLTRRNGECIEWVGGNNGKYGVVGFLGRTLGAHRVAWAMAHGEWPQLLVCHRCDNPRCVRPEHLFLGTQRDNLRDMHTKGRWSCSDRSGERNSRAKLTREQAAAIRAERRGGATLSSVARKYGIGTSQVFRIARGEQWT